MIHILHNPHGVLLCLKRNIIGHTKIRPSEMGINPGDMKVLLRERHIDTIDDIAHALLRQADASVDKNLLMIL